MKRAAQAKLMSDALPGGAERGRADGPQRPGGGESALPDGLEAALADIRELIGVLCGGLQRMRGLAGARARSGRSRAAKKADPATFALMILPCLPLLRLCAVARGVFCVLHACSVLCSCI